MINAKLNKSDRQTNINKQIVTVLILNILKSDTYLVYLVLKYFKTKTTDLLMYLVK